jgi:hypothetical protein
LDSQLEAQVVAFAASHYLGRPVAAYRPRRWGTGRLITLLVFGVVFLVAIVGFMFLWLAFRTPNLNKKLAAKRVYLFEYGFVTADRTGPLEVYRWDAIHTVFQEITDRYANGVKVATTYKFTINRADGATVTLTEFYADIAGLGRHISEQVANVHLPSVQHALAAGRPVPFGDVALSTAGVSTPRGESVPWEQIEAVQVRSGYVSFRRAGKWLSISRTAAKDIPNLYLFLYLANRLHQGSRA